MEGLNITPQRTGGEKQPPLFKNGSAAYAEGAVELASATMDDDAQEEARQMQVRNMTEGVQDEPSPYFVDQG